MMGRFLSPPQPSGGGSLPPTETDVLLQWAFPKELLELLVGSFCEMATDLSQNGYGGRPRRI